MIDRSEFRFVFIQRGEMFGLTKDEALVRRTQNEGMTSRSYEREPGIWEWEVNLGKVEGGDSGNPLRPVRGEVRNDSAQ